MHTSKSCVSVADYNSDGKPIFLLVVGWCPVVWYHADLLSPAKSIGERHGKVCRCYCFHAPSLQHAGMITSAMWTDLNKDQFPDLLVAGEWMPVKVFINKGGN